jgi:hypothetical protein
MVSKGIRKNVHKKQWYKRTNMVPHEQVHVWKMRDSTLILRIYRRFDTSDDVRKITTTTITTNTTTINQSKHGKLKMHS